MTAPERDIRLLQLASLGLSYRAISARLAAEGEKLSHVAVRAHLKKLGVTTHNRPGPTKDAPTPRSVDPDQQPPPPMPSAVLRDLVAAADLEVPIAKNVERTARLLSKIIVVALARDEPKLYELDGITRALERLEPLLARIPPKESSEPLDAPGLTLTEARALEQLLDKVEAAREARRVGTT
jgi:hypothetical protein